MKETIVKCDLCGKAGGEDDIRSRQIKGRLTRAKNHAFIAAVAFVPEDGQRQPTAEFCEGCFRTLISATVAALGKAANAPPGKVPLFAEAALPESPKENISER